MAARKGQLNPFYKHGHATKVRQSAEYLTWLRMLGRCRNPNDKNYREYGGRGICVCQRWSDSFIAFLEDMGPRPSKNHSIDRISNDGNYEPKNCRWATRSEQNRNTRQNRLITFNGMTMCITDWARLSGLHRKTLSDRLDRGWSVERALASIIGLTIEQAREALK